MSYYKDTKKVGKMFARLTTGGSNPVKAGSLTPAAPKQKKTKKAKKAKKDKQDREKAKEIIEDAPLLIVLSDQESSTSDVSINPRTVSNGSASGSGCN